MTDLHTHILPQMDDGAKTVQESLALLEMERSQGVDTVVLTPHFYRDREDAETFLARRAACMELLDAALPQDSPSLVLGAEVAWFSSLLEEPGLEKLCLDDRGTILIELPYAPWSKRLTDQLYQFVCSSGLTPVLAHVERFLPLQQKSQIEELFSMGLAMQMTADVLLPAFGRSKMLKLLKSGEWYIGSDCHNLTKRKPCMGEAAKILFKKFPAGKASDMLSWQP